MKRWLGLVCLAIFLCGCSNSTQMDTAMDLRDRFLQSNGCSFQTKITADYTESVYMFSMKCQTDQQGNLQFTVTDPESIRNIQGSIAADDSGNLTFDTHVLAFPLIADGQATPVSAPYIFTKALRGGYLTACGRDGDNIKISIDDSYEENALHVDIWTDKSGIPHYAEILWKGSRILSMEVENFTFV